MLTQEKILEAVKKGRKPQAMDGRDFSRLTEFFRVEQWGLFGFSVKEGVNIEDFKIKEWSEKSVIDQLRDDVSFGFEKALGRCGISAGFMNDTVKMWMWVLEDDLQHHEAYAQYGLPLLKAIAVKYKFENPIGEDKGTECTYAAH